MFPRGLRLRTPPPLPLSSLFSSLPRHPAPQGEILTPQEAEERREEERLKREDQWAQGKLDQLIAEGAISVGARPRARVGDEAQALCPSRAELDLSDKEQAARDARPRAPPPQDARQIAGRRAAALELRGARARRGARGEGARAGGAAGARVARPRDVVVVGDAPGAAARGDGYGLGGSYGCFGFDAPPPPPATPGGGGAAVEPLALTDARRGERVATRAAARRGRARAARRAARARARSRRPRTTCARARVERARAPAAAARPAARGGAGGPAGRRRARPGCRWRACSRRSAASRRPTARAPARATTRAPRCSTLRPRAASTRAGGARAP